MASPPRESAPRQQHPVSLNPHHDSSIPDGESTQGQVRPSSAQHNPPKMPPLSDISVQREKMANDTSVHSTSPEITLNHPALPGPRTGAGTLQIQRFIGVTDQDDFHCVRLSGLSSIPH